MMKRCKRDSISTWGHAKSNSTGSKKQLDDPLDHRRQWVEPPHEQISVRRQCPVLGVNRAGLSYTSGRARGHLPLMHWLDEPYTRRHFNGVLRLTAGLRHQGHAVHAKRVRRFVRQMGLMAVYPTPRLSQPGTGGPLYPD